MSGIRLPKSLTRFCRQVIPVLHRATSGRRILQTVRRIVETDRWDSFDRFHETTQTLARQFEDAGAEVEVYPVRTGGVIGNGRWIIQEAWDVREATMDLLSPRKRRVVDYRRNPWQVMQLSTSTPPEGITCELVPVGAPDEIRKMEPNALAGKMVLTQLKAAEIWEDLWRTGAIGVVTDAPVKDRPDATAWSKFGWGGVPMERAAGRLVGLSISAREGEKLRKLHARSGPLKVHVRVDIRRYAGSHDVVSGLVAGRDDPDDEVWSVSHSCEPGAVDNASGVAAAVEIARVIERLISRGRLPRPRRTIRLVSGFECYGFFNYLEHARRYQPPLAGVCIDMVGAKPEICRKTLSWHATIPMSAGFVDGVGKAMVRAALRLDNPGYRLSTKSFVSTADTLLGEPKYGFPCPWITNCPCNGYHSSADVPSTLEPRGLAACATAMAGYLYYLADAATPEAIEIADWQTEQSLAQMEALGRGRTREQVEYRRDRHAVSLNRLKRWLWGGDRASVFSHFAECERRVAEAAKRLTPRRKRGRSRHPDATLVPRRTVPLAAARENTPPDIRKRIHGSNFHYWSHCWADGERNLDEIAGIVAVYTEKEAPVDQVAEFFKAYAEIGYLDLIAPSEMISRKRLVEDFRSLGVKPGMDLMVHSSLSAIGHVAGGADTVIDALLRVIGKRGNLMMPSFNHHGVKVYNPLATPTRNGAIPDAFWRRPEAVRSDHPSHPVAVIGPDAERLCARHAEVGVWAPESPIAQLIHGGGYILALGVTNTASTAYHVAEVSVDCRCLDSFGRIHYAVAPDGRVEEVPGLAWRSRPCPVSPVRMDKTLDRRGLQTHGKVGDADATLVKALDLWNVRREHLRCVCPTCRIRPRQ